MQDPMDIEDLDYRSLEAIEQFQVIEYDGSQSLEIIYHKLTGKFYRVKNYYDPKLVEVIRVSDDWVEKDEEND